MEGVGERGDSRAQLSGCPQGFQHAANLEYTFGKARLIASVFGNAIEGMNDSGVIAAAERVADFDELQGE